MTRFIPGHGAPGGRGIVEEQARYHGEVEKIVRGAADREEARRAIVERFPGRAFPEAIASALVAFGGSGG